MIFKTQQFSLNGNLPLKHYFMFSYGFTDTSKCTSPNVFINRIIVIAVDQTK